MRQTLSLKPRFDPLTAAEAFANLTAEDQHAIESAARTGDWVGKYKADGFSPENQIWNAIEAAFAAWCANPRNAVPFQVRGIFARMAKVVKPTRELLRQATPKERSHLLQPSGGQ